MDRLDAMHLFVRVAELGSFSAVAQQLGVARSVVTRQIAALEAHLGAKLMARSTRRLTLTSAGTAYLEKCRVILNLVEAAETGIAEERQTPRGSIRLSVPLSFGLKRLAPLLLEFSNQYPEVALDMDFSDRRSNLIEEGWISRFASRGAWAVTMSPAVSAAAACLCWPRRTICHAMANRSIRRS